MSTTGQAILDHLRKVEAERKQRLSDLVLAARVDALKRYQHQRFERTYKDMLSNDRYVGAARFFLEELYGPHDFTTRDAQFARVVPALVRLFPSEFVETVAALAALHALSEELDSRMACHIAELPIRRIAYVRAWQHTGTPQQRERQIELTLAAGRALDAYTRNSLLRRSLRLMRRPARVAGLAALQSFLERGFDTFRGMGGAGEFLRAVSTRERALAKRLFEVDLVALGTPGATDTLEQADPLSQLP